MKNEQIVERGRVISLKENNADVTIARSEHCEACDSLFCSPKSNSERIITVSNKIKAKVGDEVEVSIGGDVLLKLSAFVYGLPILLIVGSVVFGLFIFDGKMKELYSAGLAAIVSTVYYIAMKYIANRNKNKPNLPIITKIIV